MRKRINVLFMFKQRKISPILLKGRGKTSKTRLIEIHILSNSIIY